MAAVLQQARDVVHAADFPQQDRDERRLVWTVGAAALASIDRLHGGRDHIDETVAWSKQAMRAASPADRSGAVLRLAFVLYQRKGAGDLAAAVSHLERLLDDRLATPTERQTAAGVLALALQDHAATAGPDRLTQGARRVVHAADEAAGDTRAELLLDASRLLRRADRLSPSDKLEPQVEELLRQAHRSAAPGNATWLAALVDIGNVMLGRAEATADAGAARRARAMLHLAATATAPGSPEWLEITNNQGNAEYVEARLRSDHTLLATATMRLEDTFRSWPSDSESRWRVAANLSAALQELYEWTGDLDHLNRAIGCLRDLGPSHEAVGSVAMNLGVCLSARFRRTGNILDAVDAIDLLDQAARTSDDVAAARSSEGNAWADLFEVTGDPEHLNLAITARRRALRSVRPGTLDWAIHLSNLGHSLNVRGAVRGRIRDLREAHSCLTHALRATPRGVIHRSKMHQGLADSLVALATRAQTETEARSLRRRARYHFRSALNTDSPTLPEVALTAGITWGNWALARRSWREALDAFDLAEQASLRVDRAQQSWDQRELWLRTVQGVAQGLALAHARRHDPVAARQALVSGRLRLITDRLPVSTGEPGPALDRPQRVYLAVAETGAVALRGSSVRNLDQLTAARLEERIAGLRSSYQRRGGDPLVWQRELDDVARWTRDHVLGAVHDLCRDYDGPVELVPTGLVAALPLVAGWQLCTSSTSEPQSLALALDGIGHRPAADGDTVHRLLAVADPRPTKLTPLPSGRLEVAAARASLPDGDVLVGRAARFEKVLELLPGATIAHLVCHGSGDREEPLTSRLHLAGGDLQVADLLNTDLAGLELVVLSACESGVIGDPTPDEAIGLPAALIAAGVNGVIAASWAVDDLMATTLFSRFWATWSPSDHPAQHLGRVQHWARQVTNDELADEFRAHRNRRRSIPASARRLWNTRRPYRSAVHWAAFGYHVA